MGLDENKFLVVGIKLNLYAKNFSNGNSDFFFRKIKFGSRD